MTNNNGHGLLLLAAVCVKCDNAKLGGRQMEIYSSCAAPIATDFLSVDQR